jgi:DNA-binding transcriptional MerR regulator
MTSSEDMRDFSISELADEAGVTPRTIRFYTAEGLLPPPDTRGRYARYDESHLNRLRLIQQLKEAFLPLHAIRARLDQIDDEDIARLTSAREAGSAPTEELGIAFSAEPLFSRESAAEYIRRVAGPELPAPAAPPAAPALRAALGPRFSLRRRAAPPVPAGEQWERITLSPELEIHVRTPRSPKTDRIIELIIESLKQTKMP